MLPFFALLIVQDPLIRVSSRLVEINVVATNRDGTVGDLRQTDFQILDGKVERKISFFSVHRAQEVSPARAPLPQGFRTNRPERFGTPGTVTILLFDGLNTAFADQILARRQIVEFLSGIGPGDRVAVYLLRRDLTVLQDFTDDPKSLVDAVRKVRATAAVEMGNSSGEKANTIDETLNRFLELMSKRVADFAVMERARLTMAAIESIARHAAQIPGRKNLVWVSGGFPLGLNQRPSESIRGLSQYAVDHSEEVLRFARTVAAAKLSVYPVDARGLTLASRFSASDATVNARSIGTPPETVSNHETMELIAAQTGGRAFLNTNDVSGAIRQAINDAAVGYTLGFYVAEDEKDGKFHPIKIKVARPGTTLRHQSGYLAEKDTPLDPKRASGGLSAALSGVLESASVHIVGGLIPGEGPDDRVLRVFVEPTHLRIAESSGRWKASLVFSVAQVSANGETLSTQNEPMNLNLTAAQFASLQKDGVMLSKPIVLDRGAVEVRFAVLDISTGRTGSLFLSVAGR